MRNQMFENVYNYTSKFFTTNVSFVIECLYLSEKISIFFWEQYLN